MNVYVLAGATDETFQLLKEKKWDLFWKEAGKELKNFPLESRILLERIFEVDPGYRPTVADVSHNRWVRQAIDYKAIEEELRVRMEIIRKNRGLVQRAVSPSLCVGWEEGGRLSS